MVDQQYSLRERKHLETRVRLQDAAIGLVLKNGLDKTTVDAISKVANVSPRTFFNYFDSKEDAILGFYKGNGFESMKFDTLNLNEGYDVKLAVIDMLLSLFDPIFANRDLHKKVMKLAKKYPQLLEKKVSHVSKMHEKLVESTKQIMKISHPEMDENVVSTNSQIISVICVGGVKIAMKELSVKKNLSAKSIRLRATEIINELEKVL